MQDKSVALQIYCQSSNMPLPTSRTLKSSHSLLYQHHTLGPAIIEGDEYRWRVCD